jgi:hypothetical protein
VARSPNEDAHPARLERIVDDVGDLGGELFLDLRVFGKKLHLRGGLPRFRFAG